MRTTTTLEPVQWPARKEPTDSPRLFADGHFSTPDGKARFIAPERPLLREETSAEYPLRLNTGRLRDQWHSMTRSGQSPKLGAHKPEPFVEIHPLDAKAHGLSHNGFAHVRSAHGSCTLKVVDLGFPAARLDLRADPLERRQCVVGACWRSGVATDRSVLGPA